MTLLKPRNARWQAVCDFYRIRPGYWFAPKLYGYGATPVRWQGWALVAIFAAAAMGTAWLARHESATLFGLLIPVTIAFVWICHAKTDGEWRWRWGVD
jgi:RES domain-containing protein